MILVEVGQAVVDEYIVSPVLVPNVLLLDVKSTVARIPNAICVALVQVCDHILAHLISITIHIAVCVLYEHLLHSAAEVHEANAKGDEGDAEEEEGGQDGASRENRLPGWQGLLLEF